MNCPACGSQQIVKNGFTPKDKQKYKCADCKKQFVMNPIKTVISEEKRVNRKSIIGENIASRYCTQR